LPEVPALLVTCDLLQADVLGRALVEAGCPEIASAASIEDALALTKREAFRLAVVDLGPDDAAQLARIPKLVRKLRGTPLVVIASPECLDAALAAGATDGLTRPVHPGELVARLRGALRRGASDARRTSRLRKLTESLDRLRSTNHELERLVCVDALTGIANRRHALALLDAEHKRALRDHAELSVIMVDLDCFHSYNERYGHPGGDRCLQRVADAMVLCLRRPSDFLGRYGGEELIAVLPNTNGDGAALVAERLRAAVEALKIPHVTSACGRVVTISVGFASFSEPATVEQLVAAADSALLRAKTTGRNRVCGHVAPSAAAAQPAQRWTRFAPVIADPWYADRIPDFLAAARDDARFVAANARDGNLDGAALIARRLKASAIEHGFDQLRRLAGDLVRSVRAGDSLPIADRADEIVQYVDHVQVVYRRPASNAD
jgi:two-component system chemotaxis family response regulator WspR